MRPFPPALLALYPQPEGCHPERPWWRLRRSAAAESAWRAVQEQIAATGMTGGLGGQAAKDTHYERSDGRRAPRDADLDAIDREHPLLVPPPRPGQVWAFPHGEVMVVGTERGRYGSVAPVWGNALVRLGDWHVMAMDVVRSQWPPPDAFLLYDPFGGAPWAPAEQP